MKNLGLLVLALVLSVLLGLLGTTVVLSVSSLFGLTFLAELGFVKLYGLISIFQIVNYKDKDSEEDLSEDERVNKAFYRVFLKAFLFLTFWGISFLMYYILT
jgi:hypothetical protein